MVRCANRDSSSRACVIDISLPLRRSPQTIDDYIVILHFHSRGPVDRCIHVIQPSWTCNGVCNNYHNVSWFADIWVSLRTFIAGVLVSCLFLITEQFVIIWSPRFSLTFYMHLLNKRQLTLLSELQSGSKTYLQCITSMQPFKSKWNEFHQNVKRVNEKN